MAGTLYIIGTPIGNLQDITLRAIDALKNADLIACEDTRHTKVLLNRYSIKTAATSYHKFNIKAKTRHILDQIGAGKNVALVSDAGMPGISDPGEELIKAALEEGLKVEVIPGPSAFVCALSLSGINGSRFVFEGFLPLKASERNDRLQALAEEQRTVILYEAPHRLARTLADLKAFLGDRHICVARELTKKFEETTRGKISAMIDKFNTIRPKGEFVIVIEGIEAKKERKEEGWGRILVGDMVKAGMPKSEAVKIVSRRLNLPKNELYRESLRD